jgi:hypothetical protein
VTGIVGGWYRDAVGGYVAPVSNTDDIRGWAMALPEVTEKQHRLFKVPKWQVRGKTFLGIGKDQMTVVFCVSETDANKIAAADPDTCAAVRRQDARKSFLGVQVALDSISDERLRSLVEDGWRQQAPKRLVVEFGRGSRHRRSSFC